jgi:hypothetical protein
MSVSNIYCHSRTTQPNIFTHITLRNKLYHFFNFFFQLRFLFYHQGSIVIPVSASFAEVIIPALIIVTAFTIAANRGCTLIYTSDTIITIKVNTAPRIHIVLSWPAQAYHVIINPPCIVWCGTTLWVKSATALL